MKKSDITILVADDDPDYLFQTVFNLGKAGYKTIAVESQAEAESGMKKRGIYQQASLDYQ